MPLQIAALASACLDKGYNQQASRELDRLKDRTRVAPSQFKMPNGSVSTWDEAREAWLTLAQGMVLTESDKDGGTFIYQHSL